MNPLQQASVRRKIWYFGAILALFTISMLWRGEIDIPLSGSPRAASSWIHQQADWVSARTVLSQARRMELRELEQGDPEVAGSAIRLGLVGSRGLVVTYLWLTAIEKQKRNDFHELELLVRTVTTLQPHFITPWIFQSWNIAYNVSVEMQSLGDMYFYIARGIELLAEGERRNRRSPDMRYQIGFYYQNKFGVSDQVQTLRCLFQLSCMPPNEWDPDGFLAADKSVDLVAFRRFCEQHPMLVRRLRGDERRDRDKKSTFEALQTSTPEDVVEFLRTNRKVPSRYKNATDLAPDKQQFPALPQRFNEGPDEANPKEPVDDPFSGYLAARAWFTYANAIVPPNPVDAQGNPIPSYTPRPDEYDQFKYRVPRLPMLIIFRQGAPRAQHYQAELMQKDGWFDAEGWEIDARSDESKAWFTEKIPDQGGRRKLKVVVGTKANWSQDAWKRAAEMWRNHGEAYALVLSQSRMTQLLLDAGVKSQDSEGLFDPREPTPEQAANEAFMRRRNALAALFFYKQNRQLTNFPYYLGTSEAEQLPDTVQARKILWQAGQARRVAETAEAIRLYEDGLDKWKKVLIKNPTFHRSERSDLIEEQTFEYELEYLRLLVAARDKRVWQRGQEEYKKAVETVGTLLPFVSAATQLPATIQMDWNSGIAERYFSPFAGPMPLDLPLKDGRGGGPWIQAHVKHAVLSQQGIGAAPKQPAAPPPPQPPSGAGGETKQR